MQRTLSYCNGDKMPLLGLGTWCAARSSIYRAIREAIAAGYRHIDCAPIYGNEKEIGQALNDAFKAGDVRREDLWVTSKLWGNNHGRENVLPALQKTLQDLQLNYLDLYLIHWPVAIKHEVKNFPENGADFLTLEEQPLADTWQGMEDCLHQDFSRHIGVSNFSTKKLTALLQVAQAAPEVNQVELHPYLQQNSLLAFCTQKNVFLTAYTPLGRPNPRSGALRLLAHDLILKIAEKHAASPAQIVLAWGMHRKTAVIPKSVNPRRIRENFRALSVCLDEEDMQQIQKLDENKRYVDGSFYAMSGSPYTPNNIWDE